MPTSLVMRNQGPHWARLTPKTPSGRLGFLGAGRGPHRTLDTPGAVGPPPTYLRAHLPEGTQGAEGAVVTHLRPRASAKGGHYRRALLQNHKVL